MNNQWIVRLSRVMAVTAVAFSVTLLTASGCAKKPKPNFSGELAPGQLALRKISPSEYPDFSAGMANHNLPNVLKSIDYSLAYMERPSSQSFFPYLDIDHDRVVATLNGMKAIIADELSRPTKRTPAEVNALIAQNFEVYKSCGAPDSENGGFTDRVLFTGYFTPIYDASLTRTGPYQWPLYKRPADLVVDPATGQTLGRKGPDGKTIPGYTRKEIEQGHILDGSELVYLKTRWEAYVITVQGSARLKLLDGRTYEIGYSGTNGYDYTAPGRLMVKDGVITADDLNIKRLGQLFESDPKLADKYLWQNQRYVFFTETQGGPFGSLNVPVTPFASIATDKNVLPNIYPRALMAFAHVPMPATDDTSRTNDFGGFLLDQDNGGGIRAAGRCDIFMGIGPEAERIAGFQLHEGELYYLAIKPELVQKYLGK